SPSLFCNWSAASSIPKHLSQTLSALKHITGRERPLSGSTPEKEKGGKNHELVEKHNNHSLLCHHPGSIYKLT
ncbi:MAG: hypothetical protein R6U32_07170, partial [Candidatus Woesearchaeota archaeon]